MKILLHVLFSLWLLANCDCQKIFLGKCPDVTVKQNFNVDLYAGLWYEYEKYFAVFELGGRCITATYTKNSDGTITVLNKQYDKNDRESTIAGSARFAGSSSEAKLIVTFPNVPAPGGSNYWVLDTDYGNYAVVYTCSDLVLLHYKFVWILTRSRQPTQQTLNTAYDVLNANRVDLNKLRRTDQTNCPN